MQENKQEERKEGPLLPKNKGQREELTVLMHGMKAESKHQVVHPRGQLCPNLGTS